MCAAVTVPAPCTRAMRRCAALLAALLATAAAGAATLISGVDVDTASCSVPREPHLSVAGFVQRYRGVSPVVFSTGSNNAAFRAGVTHDALMRRYADVNVVLSSSNSYSHDRLHTTLGDYLTHHMAPVTPDMLSNETFYLFGDTRSAAWLKMQEAYVMPLSAATDDPALSFGVGSQGSGVAMHAHGPAWAETLLGAKRWYLSPPHAEPLFQPDEMQLTWVAERRDSQPTQVLECTVSEGEAIYLPHGWYHATLNLEPYNAFMSVFTREGADGGEL